MQVGAGGRDGGVPEIVPPKAQVELLIRHVAAGGVTQPVR